MHRGCNIPLVTYTSVFPQENNIELGAARSMPFALQSSLSLAPGLIMKDLSGL